MGTGTPYYAATPVADFLNSQWDTIVGNIGAKSEQVCVGGFIFEWSDEYWKGNNPSVQQGGPNGKFRVALSQAATRMRPDTASLTA